MLKMYGYGYISIAGKKVLIHSVILAMTLFLLLHYVIPKDILNEIEKGCQGFLWGHGENVRKFHWLA